MLAELLILLMSIGEEILERSYFRNIRKDKFSFSKAERFPSIKSKHTIDFSHPASTISNRSASLGYGNKYDFYQEKQRSPSPSLYDTSINHSSSHTQKGKSFGVGRDKAKSNSYINPELSHIPSVGQYDEQRLQKKNPSSIIISKHKEDHFIQETYNPSPAHYNPTDHFISRRKKSTQFGFGKSKRFEHKTSRAQRMIGPGSYENLMKASQNKATINQASRKTYAIEAIEKSISPGPKYYVS